MALNEQYIVDESLSSYFVDKTTGEPLAIGYIEFYQDDNRTIPKPVYRLSGSPPNYTYSALPDPVSLNIAGQPVDNSGNLISIYYRPYDDFGNLQLYYIRIFNSDGVLQRTVEAWPNITTSTDPTEDTNAITNLISNPQFVDLYFNPETGLNYSYAGNDSIEIAIAPDWVIEMQHSGAGTLTVNRNSIAGSADYPTQPAYTLTVQAGANCDSLKLRQRFLNNPSMLSPRSTTTSQGYISGSVTFETGQDVIMEYRPNPTGSAQTILNASNVTGSPQTFQNTIQLIPGNNTSTSDTGYVDIVLTLNESGTTTLTSVQLVALESNQQNVKFDEQPVNRQKDYLFHTYNPLLQYKPLPSYLIGWDFPYNPAQINGDAGALGAIGANKSDYVWDQTIVFQSLNNGVTYSRAGTGALRLTAAANNVQMAVIQYVETTTARKILNDRIAVHLAGSTSLAGGVTATVSLYYTNVALPDIVATNNSVVATLDANGKPATFNNAWTEVPRGSLGQPQFTLDASATNNYNDYSFNQWDLEGAAAVNAAQFVAIVIGFAPLAQNETIDIYSCGLYSGDIATRPAPMSHEDHLNACQRYYEMSYETPADVGTATVTNALRFVQDASMPDGGGFSTSRVGSFCFEYVTTKYSIPNLTIYSTQNGTAGSLTQYTLGNINYFDDRVVATFWQLNNGNKKVNYRAIQNTGLTKSTPLGTFPNSVDISFQYVADARLGVI